MTDVRRAPVRIAGQFNGPNTSGNGGYVSGVLGDWLTTRHGRDVPVTVNLRKPPPLEVDLELIDDGDGAGLYAGETLIGAAAPTTFDDFPPPVPPVDLATAKEGMAAYEGYEDHPFPRCFACGSARGPGDGLQVFSGPLAGGGTGCPWSPHPAFGDSDGRLGTAFTWAALDCPGGWAADIKGRPMVLARMTVGIQRRPEVGEPCILVGALRGIEGRKNHTATTLYGADGDVAGRSEQLWITIDIEDFS